MGYRSSLDGLGFMDTPFASLHLSPHKTSKPWDGGTRISDRRLRTRLVEFVPVLHHRFTVLRTYPDPRAPENLVKRLYTATTVQMRLNEKFSSPERNFDIVEDTVYELGRVAVNH